MESSPLILGMVLLPDLSPVNLEQFGETYRRHYPEELGRASNQDGVFTCDVGGEPIFVAFMPMPVPEGDLANTAQYAYNWPTAMEELAGHRGHLVVTLMQGEADAVRRHRIFTQVVCTILRITPAIGLYQGGQSLLIPAVDYLGEAALMEEEFHPLNLWIYFGLRVTEEGVSGYTYGMAAFGKRELEVVGSRRDMEAVRAFLFNIAHYVLDHDVVFETGQTIGLSADEKIAITLSPGVNVAGETFKLGY